MSDDLRRIQSDLNALIDGARRREAILRGWASFFDHLQKQDDELERLAGHFAPVPQPVPQSYPPPLNGHNPPETMEQMDQWRKQIFRPEGT